MHRSLRTAIATGAASAVLLTACGGSPTASSDGQDKTAPEAAGAGQQVYDEVMALSGEARRTRLVELAQAEGQLNLYTSMTSGVAEAVTEAFSDAFDIDINLYRASGETVVQRILQEAKAGYAGNDVVETDGIELSSLELEGVMAPYKGERRDLVPEAGRYDTWTATRFNIFTPSWNTELVKKGEEPTTWESLADPKWDGKLSMELGDVDWYVTLRNHWLKEGKSKEEVDKLFADMADGAKVVKGHTVQGELLAAGQFAVVASNYSFVVARAKAKGAPVEYLPFVKPAIARPNGIGLMKTAQNPAAAVLFTDWLLEEGQEVLTEEKLTAAIAEGDNSLEKVELISVDIPALIKDSEKLSADYEDLLRKAEAAK